jgi:hypothetical protein
MTGRLPLIVVTLPGRTVADVLRQAETARAAGGDLAEVRLDLGHPKTVRASVACSPPRSPSSRHYALARKAGAARMPRPNVRRN